MTSSTRPPTRRIPRLLPALTLLVLAASLAGCSIAGMPGPVRPAVAGFDDVYTQDVDWQPCAPGPDAPADALAAVGRDGSERQCATIRVPLDWSDPSSEARIDVALAKYPATSGEPIGTLLTNPGGPGGSGLDKADRVAVSPRAQTILEAYDLIGFDPRGIGRSTPLECAADGTVPATVVFARCVDDAPVAHHMGTSSVARDMDVIRVLSGDEHLNYLGYSYGTVLGATYATLFPSFVGRMILDSAIDATWASPIGGFDQQEAIRLANADLGNYCRLRAAPEDCPTWTDDAGLQATYGALDETPWVASDGETVGGAQLETFLTTTDYTRGPARLARLEAVGSAMAGEQEGIDRIAQQTSDSLVDLSGRVVSCFSAPRYVDWAAVYDHVLAVSGDPDVAASYSDGDRAECASLPEWGSDITTTFDARGSAPIVVFGVTGDHATPYASSESLVAQLGTATLVTLEAAQHGATYSLSTCADDIANAYLLRGEVPDPGIRCTNDDAP